MDWHHLFIPHRNTHSKAHLISWHGLVVYVLIFILLQVSFSIVSYVKPGILGVTSSIDSQKLIELTNQERRRVGLKPLSANSALSQAAYNKALNMFSENYWAHFAPSGKTPWDFILSADYRFTFAGENLAKNFSKEGDVVSAWMASSSHRDNILNATYNDIGIAVAEGVIDGQNTVLVVQMFGSTDLNIAAPTVNIGGEKVSVAPTDYNQPLRNIASEAIQQEIFGPVVNPYQVSKVFGIFIISLVSILLVVDFIVLKRRGVFRFSSHHFTHLIFLSFTTAAILNSSPGSIL